jgi:hypothetical protein
LQKSTRFIDFLLMLAARRGSSAEFVRGERTPGVQRSGWLAVAMLSDRSPDDVLLWLKKKPSLAQDL